MERRRWAGLVVIGLAVSLVIVDITVLNVIVPAIVADLGITATQVQWVQEAYTLVFASLLLPLGRLGDRIGRRRTLVLGVLLFAAASAVAAAARSGGMLIAARVLQGVGGAAIFPAALSLINSTFTGRQRGAAFAVWGSLIGSVAAVGPLLGGWLATGLSWRLAFGVNLPLAALAIAGMLTLLAESRDPTVERGADVAGVAMSVGAAALLVFALIEGRTLGWWAPLRDEVLGARWGGPVSPVPVALVLSVGLALVFVDHEACRARRGATVLLDTRLFSIPSFRRGTTAAMIIALGEFGILFALSLWLQNALGYSAVQAGLALLPLALTALAAGGAGAALTAARGAATTVRLGLALKVLGVAGVGAVVAVDTPWWLLALPLAVYGVGVGLATAQLGNLVLADVPRSAGGQAAGMQSTAQQVGSALGIAVLGTVLFTSLGTGLDDRLREAGVADAARTAVVATVQGTAGGAVHALAADPATASAAEQARAALTAGTRAAVFTAAGVLLLGLLTTLRLHGSPAPAWGPRPGPDPAPAAGTGG